MANNIGLDSGQLRHQLTIYSPPTGLDAYGQALDSTPSMTGWTLYLTRWGKIEPNTGSPYIQSDTIRNLTTHRITFRYVEGLTPRYRIVYGSRVFNVVGLISSEERQIDTVVAAQEVL